MQIYKHIGLATLILLPVLNASAADKTIIGWVEPVMVTAKGMTIDAKIDSGADHSSLYASDVKISEQGNTTWVSFNSLGNDGETYHFKEKLLRYTYVKRRGVPPQKRPVIKLSLCLANQQKDVQVNLTDRNGYKYHMLIGRSFIKPDYLIDVEFKHMSKPDCNTRED